jgi:hypothetical protein
MPAVFVRYLPDSWYLKAMKKTYGGFSRRGPDVVTEELVAALSSRASFEFKALFDIVHANMRARKAASGGEEMLRLRAYEKLQNLVQGGMVKKTGKKYKGAVSALQAFSVEIKNWKPTTTAAKTVAA